MLTSLREPSVFDEDHFGSNSESNGSAKVDGGTMTGGRNPHEESISDIEESSTSSTTTPSYSTMGGISTLQEDNKYFAAQETRRVRKLKLLLNMILLLVTIATCCAVYIITTRGQQAEMDEAFEGSANKVITSFQEILEQKIAAIASLGVTFTSYAKKQYAITNETWPFVTMNDFQQRAASAQSLSDAYFLELLPIVTDENRWKWEEYSVANKQWLQEGRAYQEQNGLGTKHRQLELNEGDAVTGDVVLTFTKGESSISEKIFTFDETFNVVSDPGPGPYFPIWQESPILPEPRDLVNYNLVDYGGYGPYIQLASETGQIAIGGLDVAEEGDITHPDLTTSFFAYIISFYHGQWMNYTGDPMSSVYVPVVNSFDEDREVVAVLVAIINWATYFENTLPINSKPVAVVLENTCDGPFTYEVSGDGVKYLGKGKLLDDSKYENQKLDVHFDNSSFVAEATTIALTFNQDLCQYSLTVYPTKVLEDYYKDYFPLLITVIIAAVFVVTAGVFAFYDRHVEMRQRAILNTAKRSTAIVASIFPKKVRDQLMEAPVQGNATKLRSLMSTGTIPTRNGTRLGGVVSHRRRSNEQETHPNSDGIGIGGGNSGPIADLFPECTVFFGDVEGFTAWSSVREPSQVFTLLETIYAGLDRIAAKHKVFKVETVGDCYVAVAGLPDPCPDHAVVMSKFARECIVEHTRLTKDLERTLGPDTGELRIRIGLHSGPITAGVLRGERSRFQLFGDTVNTASRLESSGQGNEIHISSQTADLLKETGYENWLLEREEKVHLKGKGSLQTYWLVLHGSYRKQKQHQAQHHTNHKGDVVCLSPTPKAADGVSAKTERLIAWNVDLLVRLIKQIVARRQEVTKKKGSVRIHDRRVTPKWNPKDTIPLEEVVEIIQLPEQTKHGVTASAKLAKEVDLPPIVVQQVREYVYFLSQLYRDNPFHSFEHASHVTMSVAKLLSRIIAPSDMDFTNGAQASATLHDHTYGITSDPLTQFACILSALIHDVDHQGVPNTTLVAERDPLVELYKGKSVAEQNSVELAWDMLMSSQFDQFRASICADQSELARFRQLVVNSVMATDIMDKDLKALRNARWDKAFSASTATSRSTNNTAGDQNDVESSSRDAVNRKATIVIEHLIQASDVAHTMQHWYVYQKWNGRLYREMYRAYKDGRVGAKDPSEFWYKGELGFFDFYIIPLAKKLKDCGVFGVSSDEYLQYAMNNRNEWERKGQEVVANLIATVQKEEGEAAKPQSL